MRLVPYVFVIATVTLVVFAIYSIAKRVSSSRNSNDSRAMPYGLFWPLMVIFTVIWGVILLFMLEFVFDDVIPW